MNARISVTLLFPEPVCVKASITFKGRKIPNGDFDIIVLSSSDTTLVHKNISRRNICYEAKLLSVHSQPKAKPRKVLCYIGPKQVSYYLFINAPFNISFQCLIHIICLLLDHNQRENLENHSKTYCNIPIMSINKGIIKRLLLKNSISLQNILISVYFHANIKSECIWSSFLN